MGLGELGNGISLGQERCGKELMAKVGGMYDLRWTRQTGNMRMPMREARRSWKG